MHTATLVVHGRARVLIDCGETWRKQVWRLAPDACILTHAHPDHADGLDRGAPCLVYATKESWQTIARFPIEPALRRVLAPRVPTRIGGVVFEAFPVVHSVRAPAIGLRITAGKRRVFYVPDVVEIPHRRAALGRVEVYVGDGASIVRPIIRRSKSDPGTRIGHASIVTQLDWCLEEGVPRMIVTHCGSAIVGADERQVRARLRALGQERGVEVLLAHDGFEYALCD
jgi:phosphoribosyl 1,2-cyclic phosphodiesterase